LVQAGPVMGGNTLLLKVVNDTDKQVDVALRSEKPDNPRSPWVKKTIQPRGTGQIRLSSPDRFIARVNYGQSTYDSVPMPLKKALGKNPNQKLRVSNVMAAPAGQAPVQKIQLALDPDEIEVGWLGRDESLMQVLEPKRTNQRMPIFNQMRGFRRRG